MGRSGLRVSAIGLGTTAFGAQAQGDEAVRVLQHAIGLGLTFIDTAVTYAQGRSEELLGRALEGRRHEVVIATKAGLSMTGDRTYRNLSRSHLIRCLELSLTRLRTDHVDLFMAHRPDANTPIDETLEAMDRMVQEGKVRYIGGSNYAAWEMARAIGRSERAGLVPWIAAENRWNVVEGLSDPHLAPASSALGFGIIAYQPLMSGTLTGKYALGKPLEGSREADLRSRGDITDEAIAAADRLKVWARARGHTTGEAATAWLLSQPECTSVIIGARSIEQLEANVKAADWRLTEAERDEVTRIAAGP